jgi:hypothetical protein
MQNAERHAMFRKDPGNIVLLCSDFEPSWGILLDGFKSPFQHCGASFAGGESCTASFGGKATPVSFNSEASRRPK